MCIWSGEQELMPCKSIRIVSFRYSHKRPGAGIFKPHTPIGKDVQPGAGIELQHITQTIKKKKRLGNSTCLEKMSGRLAYCLWTWVVEY